MVNLPHPVVSLVRVSSFECYVQMVAFVHYFGGWMPPGFSQHLNTYPSCEYFI